MLELRVLSLADTHAVARVVAGVSHTGDLVVLSGEMGAGKTAFAQGFGAALGVGEPLTSPTYTLVHSYELPRGAPARSLHHADLYRLEHTVEVADLALVELAEDDGIVLVEWGDVADGLFGDHLAVHLAVDDLGDLDDLDDEALLAGTLDLPRTIELSATGPSWARRWSRIVEQSEAFAC
jgi:tRNA threonylcarbamoyladenosine biosynthesis protein TsaE